MSWPVHLGPHELESRQQRQVRLCVVIDEHTPVPSGLDSLHDQRVGSGRRRLAGLVRRGDSQPHLRSGRSKLFDGVFRRYAEGERHDRHRFPP